MQKQNMNWFATVLRVVIYFIILTDLTELSVEFCVDEVFEDRGGLDVSRRRRGKSSSLGMPKAPQDNISRSLKHLSLGMPRKASHLSLTSIGIVFGFVSFMRYVQILERLLHLVFIFILCTMLV